MKNHVVNQIAAGLVLWAVVAPGWCALAGTGPGATQSMKAATEAWQLRMQGKVDDARVSSGKGDPGKSKQRGGVL